VSPQLKLQAGSAASLTSLGDGLTLSIGCLISLRNSGKRAIKDPSKRREQTAIWKTGF
jgi:hypothetical protein